jgi:hypothetical protein
VGKQDKSLSLNKTRQFSFLVANDMLVMPDKEIQNLFGDVTVGEPGMLRMTLCKKLARLLGGDVWCESSATGGTVFTLCLDLEVDDGGNANVEVVQGAVGGASRTVRPARKKLDAAANSDSGAESSPPRMRGGASSAHSIRRHTRSGSSRKLIAKPLLRDSSDTETDRDSLPSLPTEQPHNISQRLVSDFKKTQERRGVAVKSHNSSAKSIRAMHDAGGGGSGISPRAANRSRHTSELQSELECIRLPSQDYEFTVVRELVSEQTVAVLGELTVGSVTRQAWGCVNASQHREEALTKARLTTASLRACVSCVLYVLSRH